MEDEAGDGRPEPGQEVTPGEPSRPPGPPTSGADGGTPGPSSRLKAALPVGVTAASLLLPGLGQLALGARRIALFFLVPSLVVLAVLGVWALANGVYGVAAALLVPGALMLLFAGNVLVAGWRATAALEALGRTHPGRAAAAVSILLVVVGVGVPHLLAGSVILSANDYLDSTFAMMSTETAEPEPTDTPEPPTPEPTPTPTLAPGATPAPETPSPSPSSAPTIAPFPTDGGNGTLPAFNAKVPWERPGAKPWGDDGRFDLLLIGSDAGTSRWSRRNDVTLLVEVDVKTGAVAMIGLPRNLQNAPYPEGPARNASACGCQPGLLNEMYVEATARHPGLWPGKGAVKGIGAVRSVASEITGRPIDAVLIVDLVGVIRVVDAMGGIDINVPEAVTDDHYPDPGRGSIRLRIAAGRQHLDGHRALAYARSRHMDSDYGRMQRQQILLEAIREELGPKMILSAPALFGAAKGTAWTDLPRESLPALVELFGRAADARVRHLRIVPPRYPAFMTAAWITQIRRDVAALLPGTPNPPQSAYPRPVATPRPTPRPTPKPTPKPTARPTLPPTPGPTPESPRRHPRPSPRRRPRPSPRRRPRPSRPPPDRRGPFGPARPVEAVAGRAAWPSRGGAPRRARRPARVEIYRQKG